MAMALAIAVAFATVTATVALLSTLPVTPAMATAVTTVSMAVVAVVAVAIIIARDMGVIASEGFGGVVQERVYTVLLVFDIALPVTLVMATTATAVTISVVSKSVVAISMIATTVAVVRNMGIIASEGLGSVVQGGVDAVVLFWTTLVPFCP